MIEYYPSRRVAKGKAKDRKTPPVSIILHTTPVNDQRIEQYRKRLYREGKFDANPSRYQTLRWIYRTGRINAEDHIVCGPEDGQIFIACPLAKIAWHVGSKNHWRYNRWYKPPQWWKNTWQGKHPKQLWPQVWKGNSVNNNTIGIGFVVPAGSREPLTQGHINNLYTALDYIRVHYNVDAPTLILRHKDIHPIARTTRKGVGYDLYDSQMSKEVMRCIM